MGKFLDGKGSQALLFNILTADFEEEMGKVKWGE